VKKKERKEERKEGRKEELVMIFNDKLMLARK
jgi:hypothetical protein